VLLDAGAPLRVIATHLGLDRGERRAQLLRLARLLAERRLPTLLCGDLNDPLPFGPVSRLMRGSRLRAPLRRSFPSCWPLLPLDRIGVSRELRLESLAVHRTPAARSASDHLPLWARLHLATSIRQPAPGSAGPG
jgi:endonuclease/exonuclease/phosphatase family metal-dependent hydrolase